jgi:hypothetical protein
VIKTISMGAPLSPFLRRHASHFTIMIRTARRTEEAVASRFWFRDRSPVHETVILKF